MVDLVQIFISQGSVLGQGAKSFNYSPTPVDHYFRQTLMQPTASAPWTRVTIRELTGTVSTLLDDGYEFTPPATFSPTYDLDGNLPEDSRWRYTWDGEYRLTRMESRGTQPFLVGTGTIYRQVRLTFGDNGFSQRVTKRIEIRDPPLLRPHPADHHPDAHFRLLHS